MSFRRVSARAIVWFPGFLDAGLLAITPTPSRGEETFSGSVLFPQENLEQPVTTIPKGSPGTSGPHSRTHVRWG